MALVSQTIAEGNEFDNDVTGRGDSYREAQRQLGVRERGMRRLLELAMGGISPQRVPAGFRLLDVLGGDGTVAKTVSWRWGVSPADSWILTADLSTRMVNQAAADGFPAICQPAQRMTLRDGMFDAVLIAYGTHHIPPADRVDVYREAGRVLKPGGRLVVHDFETGGPVDRWFSEVVHKYSTAGHDYTHFHRAELHRDLTAAGFADIAVQEVYDPFEVRADTATAARDQLCDYVFDMYGLVGLHAESPDQTHRRDRTEELAATCLRYGPDSPAEVAELTVRPDGADHLAVLPRVALTGLGVKPR